MGRRLRLTGFGLLDINYFQRQGDERSTDFYGEGDAELSLGPLTFFGGGGGGQFTQRFSIDVDERIERQEKRAHVGATVRLTPLLSFTARGSGEVFTFAPGTFRLGGDIKGSLDRNTLTGAGELRYALTPVTTLVATGEVIEDRFFSQTFRRSPRAPVVPLYGRLRARAASRRDGPRRRRFAPLPGSLAEAAHPTRAPRSWPTSRCRSGTSGGSAFKARATWFSPPASSSSFPSAIATRSFSTGSPPTPFRPARPVRGRPLRRRSSRLATFFPIRTGRRLHPGAPVDHRYTGTAGLLRRFGPRFSAGGHVSWAAA